MHPGQVTVSAADLRSAIADQFPQLKALDVTALASAGTVIAPFRVGSSLVARVPLVPVGGDDARRRLAAEGAHAALLSGHLKVRVPELIGIGEPFDGYPGLWSLWTWLDGHSLDQVALEPGLDLGELALDLAEVLRAHRSLPVATPSWSGHGRGGRPLQDTEFVRRSIARCGHVVDPVAATRVWERALDAAPLDGRPVSIHGDALPGNLVISAGRLSGIIDIGEPVVGDPASDLQPAWAIFDEPERSAFRESMDLDEAAWERGRGWAFEMAIGGLHYYEHTNPGFLDMAGRTVTRLLEAP